MAAKKNERGKVVKQNVYGTIFDVRIVPKVKTDVKTGKSVWETSSYHLFIGKTAVKAGFKNVDEAGKFALENISKYDRKDKKFK